MIKFQISDETKRRLDAYDKQRAAMEAAMSRKQGNPATAVARRVLSSLVKVQHEPGNWGTGFRVDDFIITAAHCLPRYPTFDNPAFVPVWGHKKGPVRGVKVMGMSIFADADSDLAILSCHDDHWEEYDNLLSQLTPLQLAQKPMRTNVPVCAHVYGSKDKWINGNAVVHGIATSNVEFSKDIPSGTSGGPLINRYGQVIGVASHGPTRIKSKYDTMTFAFLPNALPVWVLKRLENHGWLDPPP